MIDRDRVGIPFQTIPPFQLLAAFLPYGYGHLRAKLAHDRF